MAGCSGNAQLKGKSFLYKLMFYLGRTSLFLLVAGLSPLILVFLLVLMFEILVLQKCTHNSVLTGLLKINRGERKDNIDVDGLNLVK